MARRYVHEARKRVGPKKERIRPIVARLKAAHPDAKIALRYRNELELLVAVMLSAQTTDVNVTRVTETLSRSTAAMGRAATTYSDGRALGFDQLSKFVAPEIACIHELERFEAKVGEAEELTPISLRCTTVFRLEDDGWKIVHRYADPITADRPAESVIQT